MTQYARESHDTYVLLLHLSDLRYLVYNYLRSRLAKERGIIVKARGWVSLAEEASIAYKDVADVIEVAHSAGLCRRVARMRAIGVIKG